MTKSADEFFQRTEIWREELARLRQTLKATGLTEEVKWGMPCYTLTGVNVVAIGAFKSYFGLWFFEGASLKDPKKLLVNAQEGRTKAMRQWRMTSVREIDSKTIRAYVAEAKDLAAAGKTAPKSPPARRKAPAELEAVLKRDPLAKKAFAALTPGRRRDYADYVASAKLDATKQKRIARIMPLIRAGVGLNDKYRKGS